LPPHVPTFSIDHVERIRIKICGIARPEDAAAAARAGADAIGLVMHASAPRHISLNRASDILNDLPPFVTPVLLFVDAPIDQIRESAATLQVRHLQLHGSETPEQVAELRAFTVIKAIRVDPQTFGPELLSWRTAIRKLRLTHLRGVVLETARTGQPGGTGRANDWQTVRHHRQRGDFIGLPAVIAAGGLTSESVAAVVHDIRPYAVDVSTGVESSLGVKSPEKIEAFVRAVRDAEQV